MGVATFDQATNHSFSGVMLRSSGLAWDLRKAQPYEVYGNLDFQIPVGYRGDCYDRYLIRVEELRQSLGLIQQCLYLLPDGPTSSLNHSVSATDSASNKFYMESLISKFKKFSNDAYNDLVGEVYVATESPKGEFGVYLAFSPLAPARPYRCKIKSPGFAHLQAIDFLAQGHLIADVVTIIGTQDIVFGEVDR